MKLFKEKERSRKKELTIKQKEFNLLKETCVIGIAFEILFTYMSLILAAVMYDNPDLSISETMNILAQKMSTPGYMFPVAWSKFFPIWSGLTFVLLLTLAWHFITQKNYIGTKDLGSSKFTTAEELTTELAEPFGEPGHNRRNNYIYGQNTYIAQNSTYTDKKGVRHEGLHSNNALIISETGGGKTFNYLKPNLMQMNCSYAITDPSGSTKQEMGEMLYRFGYKVRSLDIITMLNCNKYNPLKYIKDEADIKNIIQSFVANTKKEGETGGSSDPFWNDAMDAFLCSILSLLVEYGDRPDIMDGKIYNKAFPTLCEFTRMATAGLDPSIKDSSYEEFCKNSVNEKRPTALGHIFHNIRRETEGQPKPYCLREWENYKLAPEKTATTILITTSVKLDPFEVQKVINLTSDDTINLDTFGSERDVIFISTPQTADGKPYMFLASFMYTQLFSAVFNRGNYEMDGSHSVKLNNGEHIKWFKKDVSMEEIKEYVESLKHVSILTIPARLDENDVYYAIVDKDFDSKYAESLGGKNDLDAYRKFTNYVEAHSISRRPTIELAEQYVKDLQSVVIKTHHGEANPTTCRFMIDEFANIGEIPDFLKILATVRKYNIVIDIILQSRDQLKRMYEKSYSEVEDNCPITIFLGGAGLETTKAMSEKIGKTSIVVNNVNTDNKHTSSGHNVQARDLMDAAEIGRLDMKEELIMLAHYQPCIDQKYNTISHPMYKYTRDYIQGQEGKEKYCIYDVERIPSNEDIIPICIPVIEHSENMINIEPLSEEAMERSLGKRGTELEDSIQSGFVNHLSAEPA